LNSGFFISFFEYSYSFYYYDFNNFLERIFSFFSLVLSKFFFKLSLYFSIVFEDLFSNFNLILNSSDYFNFDLSGFIFLNFFKIYWLSNSFLYCLLLAMVYFLSCIIFSFILLMVMLIAFSYNTILALLGLMIIFISMGVLFIIMGMEYMGFLLLIIYVGGISIIFLFVVMLLDIRTLELQNKFMEYFTVLFLVGFFFIFEVFFVLQDNFDFQIDSLYFEDFFGVVIDLEFGKSNVDLFGEVLYNYYFMYVFL